MSISTTKVVSNIATTISVDIEYYLGLKHLFDQILTSVEETDEKITIVAYLSTTTNIEEIAMLIQEQIDSD